MGVIFGLSVECGSDRKQAELFAAHFQSLSFELITGKISTFSTEIYQDDEANWWVDSWPSNISVSGLCNSVEDAIDFSEAGFRMYAHLLLAPPFRFALVGVEVFQFITYSELINVLEINHQNNKENPFPLWEGFVIHETILEKFGHPRSFLPFGNSYQWMQYNGERYSPLEGIHEYAKKLRILRDKLHYTKMRR